MKRSGLVLAVLLGLIANAVAATTYSNIDNAQNLDDGATGWGWCTDCAGGLNQATSYSMYWGQSPSVSASSGGSTEFFISGPQYSNALWWYKLGPDNSATNFKLAYWMTVDVQASSYAQAIEADVFQFVAGREYMFATQCDYTLGYDKGVWDTWDQSSGKWMNTKIPCPGLIPGDWYYVTWTMHRTADQKIVYDKLTVAHYNSTANRLLGNSTYNVNRTASSGPLPAGWGDQLGVQFQLDLNSKGGQYPVWVDRVTLTAR
jgi:hypothetical protein